MNQRDPEATTAGDCVPEPPHTALEDQTCCFVQDDPAVITAPHLQAREPGHRAWVPPEDTGWPAAEWEPFRNGTRPHHVLGHC